MGDPCLCFLGDEVEDSSAGCFRAGAGGGRDSNKGQQGFGDGEATAEGGIDEVEEVVFWEAGVEVH